MMIMKDLLIGKTDRFLIQFIRYGFVAVVAFVIDFGLLYVFTQYLHIFYLLSATLSFFISLFFNYLLSVAWVFPSDPKKRRTQIIAFIIIGLVGLVLNLIIIWMLSEFFAVYYLVSKIVAIIIVFFWSFLARRYLFKARPTNETI